MGLEVEDSVLTHPGATQVLSLLSNSFLLPSHLSLAYTCFDATTQAQGNEESGLRARGTRVVVAPGPGPRLSVSVFVRRDRDAGNRIQ